MGQLELSRALMLCEYRGSYPSADTLVAAYMGYKSPRRYLTHEKLSKDQRTKWEEIGVRISPNAPPIEKLPAAIRKKFPFLK